MNKLMIFTVLALTSLLITGCGSSSGTNPSPPANVVATAGIGQATIAWDVVPTVASYTIFWTTDSSLGDRVNDRIIMNKVRDIGSPPFVVTGLVPGTTYYFFVASVKDGWEGSLSQRVQATPTSN